MIDLHMHTNYSDGTCSLTKLLEEAENAKLSVISITDHDNVDAYKELENINTEEIFSGKVISGVELSVVYNGLRFEILAYNFDVHKMRNLIDEYYCDKKLDLKLEFDLIMDACKKNNIIVDETLYDESMGWPIDVIYPSIKKFEDNKDKFLEDEWNNIDVFFDSCLAKKSFPLFIDWSFYYPDAKVLGDKIRDIGGLIFIAHVYRYGVESELEFLDELRKNKVIDGVEVYHSSFNEKEIKFLEGYTKKYNLLVSGGSDCHGEKKKNRKIGTGYGNLSISEDIIKEWCSL